MSYDSTFMPTVDEDARRRFEAAWREGKPRPIEDFLPSPDDSHYLATLEELVHIELENAWKQRKDVVEEADGTLLEPPRLETYLDRFPQLNQSAIVKRLGQQEYQVRMRHGARPLLGEYRQRFPEVTFSEMDGGTPQQTWPAAVVETPQVAGYEILGVLGRGGMGIVYKARQISLNRVVALKMILGGGYAGQEDLQRFRLEAAAVARLQHPNIVQIHEIGERDGRPYFSLEYVDGGSLAQKLAGTPMPSAETAPLMESLARAVHYAHQRGIVHRDLKPANILMSGEGRGASGAEQERSRPLVPKITDFGLAKQLDSDSSQTRTGQIMGTPSYMAPEQAVGRGGAIGPATDVYALGAMLYEMLTGRPPFKASTVLDTLEQVRVQEPVPPSQLQSKLPRNLETICLKCLQKEPHKRYASALYLAEDLRRFQAHEPILARPAGAWERTLKSARRHPAMTVFLAAVAAMVFGVVGLIVWHNTDLTDQLEFTTRKLEKEEKQRRDQEEQHRLDALRAKDKQRQDVLRGQIDGLQVQKKNSLGKHDWTNAKRLLSSALAKLDSEPSLANDLAALRARLHGESERLDGTRARYRSFARLRDEALFHETLLTGLPAAADVKKTRQAAESALALYGIDVTSAAAPRIPVTFLSEKERVEIREGLYELLLVLAEVAVRSHADPKGSARFVAALKMLDRAAQVLPASRAFHLRRARYLAGLHEKEQAKKERAQAEAHALGPAQAFDLFLVGEDLYQEKKLEQAIHSFTAALRVQPDHFWSQYFLAVCYLKLPQPRYDLAQTYLNACLARRQDFAWVYLLRGFAHGELGEFELAGADLAEALEKSSDSTTRYGALVNRGVLRIKQARSVEGMASLISVSAILPQSASALACGEVARRYQKNRLAEAVADLRSAIRLEERHFQAYVNLAQAQQARGNLVGAVEQMSLAIQHARLKELAPVLSALYRERAQLHLQRKDWPAALGDFAEAAKLEEAGGKPALAAADHVEIARLLFRAGKFEDVLEKCDEALLLRSDYAAAQRWRAEALLRLGRYKEAVAALEEYEKTGRPVPEIYRARGLAREKLADYALALADYTRALALGPDATVHVHRGWLYLLVYEAPKLALVDFEAALRRTPHAGDALAGRGLARVQLGDFRAAVEDAEDALQRGPKSARLTYNVARIFAQAVAKIDPATVKLGHPLLEERGRYQKRALELIRQALELLPDGQRVAFWRNYVQADVALVPIARTYEFARLAVTYGGGRE